MHYRYGIIKAILDRQLFAQPPVQTSPTSCTPIHDIAIKVSKALSGLPIFPSQMGVLCCHTTYDLLTELCSGIVNPGLEPDGDGNLQPIDIAQHLIDELNKLLIIEMGVSRLKGERNVAKGAYKVAMRDLGTKIRTIQQACPHLVRPAGYGCTVCGAF